MTQEQKLQVRDALARYVQFFETQTHAAESLQGISSSTISQIKNNNWELLSDRLWHHVACQVGFYSAEWQPADTSAYLLLRILFGDAQHYCMAYGIAVAPGLGKTFTAARYAREHAGVYYIAGNEQYNRKSFITALINAAAAHSALSVPGMMEQFSAIICEKEEALLIIDDAHKLKDKVLHLVVLLANSLAGKAGIIIMGNQLLRDRIIEGVRLKKAGFDEIYKTIGRRFITLGSLGPRDAEMVCRTNGIYDDGVVAHICDKGRDLHTITALINEHNELRMAA